MKRFLAVFLVLVSSLTIASTSVWAQATAQISGLVRDASGAVLPGVEVKATHTETGVARTTISNETGNYVLPNLPTGTYRLEAALAGIRRSISRWKSDRCPSLSRCRPTPRRSKRAARRSAP
jgi:hypothetical protein